MNDLISITRHSVVRSSCLIILVLQMEFSFSQESKYSLDIRFSSREGWLKRLDYKDKPRDSLELIGELQSVVGKLYKKSYMAASVDSLEIVNGKAKSYIYIGEKLQWAKLQKGNVEEEVLSKTGYRDKIYNQYRFRYRQFGRFVESILGYYENSGYPFVSLQLDSIRHLRDQGITAKLKLDKNKYVEIDTVEIYGGYFVAEKYLYNYLGIKPHKPYNESSIKAIVNRLDDLSFVGSERAPKVIFTETKTTLQLFLKKKRASRFDGIVGLLQNEEDGRVQFTGDVKLGLSNSFKRGELIGLNWRGLPNNTQDLHVKFNYPYLFNSPFGLDLEFNLYKRDTTFLDVISTFGIQYFLNGRDYLKVIYQNHQSSLLSTSQYESAGRLPPVLDFKTDYYGAEISLNKFDYTLNPKKGFKIVLGGKAGFKNIQKNGNLADSIYDDVELKNVIFRGNFTGGYVVPLTSRHIIYLGNQSAYLHNNQILQNELFRIGGLKTLRGFNEETIFVSMYSINTVEYRFILDKNSNLNVFGDLAYTERKQYGNEPIFDHPFGFGVGTVFDTAAGVFSVSYAVGSQRGNPIDFRAAKIHFGFLNFF